MENQNNGKATAALILGILSIVLIWVPIINLILGIIALILGIKGLKKSKEQQENGKGLSIAGIIMGSITIVGGLIFVMIAVIASFGVLNPQNLVPDKCAVTSGFMCEDFSVTTNNVGLSFENNMGESVIISGGEILKMQKNIGSCQATDGIIQDGKPFALNCQITEPFEKGTKEKLDFKFMYKKENGSFEHEVKGTLTADVK